MESFQPFRPALGRHWLILTAGLIWSAIGLMLSFLAWTWLKPIDHMVAMYMTIIGLLLASLIGGLGFSWFARRNIRRIHSLPDRVCLFAFQGWTSYPLVAVMVSLGIFLRHSSIPKSLLAPFYIGIGGGLLLASLNYYWELIYQRRLDGA